MQSFSSAIEDDEVHKSLGGATLLPQARAILPRSEICSQRCRFIIYQTISLLSTYLTFLKTASERGIQSARRMSRLSYSCLLDAPSMTRSMADLCTVQKSGYGLEYLAGKS
jgi:hypothetical protein